MNDFMYPALDLGPYAPLSDETVQAAIDKDFGTDILKETREKMAAAIQSTHQYKQGCLAVQAAMRDGILQEGDGHLIMTTQFLPLNQDPRQFDIVWRD